MSERVKNIALLSANVIAVVKYLTAAGINTLFGLAAYPILYLLLRQHLGYIAILVLCQIICVIFSYINYKLFVFKTEQSYLREFTRFISFYVLLFVFNLAALPILVKYAKLNPIIAQTSITFLLMNASYFWHRHISFR